MQIHYIYRDPIEEELEEEQKSSSKEDVEHSSESKDEYSDDDDEKKGKSKRKKHHKHKKRNDASVDELVLDTYGDRQIMREKEAENMAEFRTYTQRRKII